MLNGTALQTILLSKCPFCKWHAINAGITVGICLLSSSMFCTGQYFFKNTGHCAVLKASVQVTLTTSDDNFFQVGNAFIQSGSGDGRWNAVIEELQRCCSFTSVGMIAYSIIFLWEHMTIIFNPTCHFYVYSIQTRTIYHVPYYHGMLLLP